MGRHTIDSLLTAMVHSGDGGSDLLFAVGKPPVVEQHGGLEEFPIDTTTGLLDPALLDQLADHLIAGEQRLQNDLAKFGSCDCSYSVEGVARFRVNIFKQSGRKAIVMRKLQTQIPTLESLGLPPIFQEIVKEKNGIIFVTGATVSGNTTTLAAILNELHPNQ